MIIYAAINTENGKIYIGKTERQLSERAKEHIKHSKNGKKTHFYSAIRKHGDEKILFQEILTAENADELDQLEKMMIALFATSDPKLGYNMTAGGDGGSATLEVREKIAATLLGRKLSVEHREAISIGNRGKKMNPESVRKSAMARTGKPGRKGWNHSEEAKEKIRMGLQGNKNSLGATYSEESLKRRSQAQIGKILSEETKRKISASKMGRPQNEKHREKIRAGLMRFHHQRKPQC